MATTYNNLYMDIRQTLRRAPPEAVGIIEPLLLLH